MLTNYIVKLQKNRFSPDEFSALLDGMLDPGAVSEQIAAVMAFLTIERLGSAHFRELLTVLRERMMPLEVDGAVLDIVGTGGDGANTVNISTGSALLLAKMGVRVAKSGNHAATSLSGSADVLDALGLDINLPPEAVAEMIYRYGFGFCYAPIYQASLLKLKPIRKRLAVPTVFNMTGPLLNPASAEYLVLGVATREAFDAYVDVLSSMPIKRALVFYNGQTDELTPACASEAVLLEAGHQLKLNINPADYAIKSCQLSDLKGGDAHFNADALMKVFRGEQNALANTLMLNAGVSAYVYGAVDSVDSGIVLARDVLATGQVIELIEQIKRKNQ